MKKKFAALLLIFTASFIFILAPSAFAAYYSWADGTADDPYPIETVDDLITLRNRVNAGTEPIGKYYEFQDDFDLSSYTDWEPIGNSFEHSFRGHIWGSRVRVNISPYY